MSRVIDELRFGKNDEFLMSISISDDGDEWDIILDDYDQELISATYTDEDTAQEAWHWGCLLVNELFKEIDE